MIDLGIALLLQEHGYGEYGQNIFWNVSPVFGSGMVSSDYGLWVNATPERVAGDLYTDSISISSRFEDPLAQAKIMASVMRWGRETLPRLCDISLEPIVPGFKLHHCSIKAPTAISMDAIDEEGRWVKSLQLQGSYKLPKDDDPVWATFSPEALGIH